MQSKNSLHNLQYDEGGNYMAETETERNRSGADLTRDDLTWGRFCLGPICPVTNVRPMYTVQVNDFYIISIMIIIQKSFRYQNIIFNDTIKISSLKLQ